MSMRAIKGPTGSGKNNFVAHEAKKRFLRFDCSITYFLRSLVAAIPFIAQLYAELGGGLIPHLIIELLGDVRQVIMREFVAFALAMNPLERRVEEERIRGWVWEALAHNRPDVNHPTARPVLNRFTNLALMAKQHSSAWWSDSWLADVLTPHHPVQENAIALCTNDVTRRELETISVFPLQQQIALLFPCQNLMRPIFSNAIIAPRVSSSEVLDERIIMGFPTIHVIVADVPLEIARLVFAIDFSRKTHRQRLGGMLPHLYIVDELNDLGITPSFVNALATMRQFDFEIWAMLQFLQFENNDLRQGFLQNTDHYWMPQASPEMAQLASDDLRGLLTENRLLREEVTTRQTSRIEWIERTTLSVGKGPSGKTKTTSTTLVPVSIPEIHEERRPIFAEPRNDSFWQTRTIMESPIGTVFVKPRLQKPYVISFPEFPNSWVYPEVQEAKFYECLAKVMEKPIYRNPVDLPFPAPAARTTTMGGNGRRRRSR